MLKQSLQQRLQQKLSPQQIQVIRLLEVPALEMEEKVKQEIEENPAFPFVVPAYPDAGVFVKLVGKIE